MKTNHTNQAVKAIDQAISLSPNKSDFYIHKGDILASSEHYEEALAAFEMAIMSLSPSSYLLRYIYKQKSFVLRRLGRAVEADRAMEKFLKIHPISENGSRPLKLEWGPARYRYL